MVSQVAGTRELFPGALTKFDTKVRRHRLSPWEIWAAGLILLESVQKSIGNFLESQPMRPLPYPRTARSGPCTL